MQASAKTKQAPEKLIILCWESCMSGKGEQGATSAKIASLRIRDSLRKSTSRRQCVTKIKQKVTFRWLVSPLLWQEVCIQKETATSKIGLFLKQAGIIIKPGMSPSIVLNCIVNLFILQDDLKNVKNDLSTCVTLELETKKQLKKQHNFQFVTDSMSQFIFNPQHREAYKG
jgi:hypothetical protein